MLVALFAEDIGLLEKYFVTNLLNECHSSTQTHCGLSSRHYGRSGTLLAGRTQQSSILWQRQS
jgi:hypothetical protein